MKVIGIEDVNYISKRTGERVVGKKLHCCYESKNVDGLAVCEPIYCNSNVDLSHVNVGDEINVFYNNFRKPIAVDVLV